MKKVFSFVLIFILSISFTAKADLNFSDLDGLWSCYIYENDPEFDKGYKLFQILIYDKSAYYFSYCFDHDKDGCYCLSPVGYAEYKIQSIKDDVISFKETFTDTPTSFTAKWSSGFLYASVDGSAWYCYWPVDDQSSTFDRFTEESVPNAFPGVYDLLEEGVEIPAGIYTIGKDIPAGDYQIKALGDLRIVQKKNLVSSNVVAEFKMYSGDIFGKISLKVGEVFSITPCGIILKNYHGIFQKYGK